MAENAVLFNGKAFIKDGKLYLSVVCPPCCEPCGPWKCCYATDKFWCGETSGYDFPKRIHGTVTVSGIPATLKSETVIKNPNPPDPSCPGHRQDYHRIVTFSGMDALNGTYVGTFRDACEIEPPDSCESWTMTGTGAVCYLEVEIPAVPLTATWYERNDGETDTGELIQYEDSWTLTGQATLGVISTPSGNINTAGDTVGGLALNEGLGQALSLTIGWGQWGWSRPFYPAEYTVGQYKPILEDHAVDCDIIDETEILSSITWEGGYTFYADNPDPDDIAGCEGQLNWTWYDPIAGITIEKHVWTA